ncbi:response regulator transcription factor [Clostridium aestuarii]|uniref:Stage 0 sporulation protein A homolog n=1 Tax=Clostridium aestuarii TaxID=338193 RepID=A0ABT4D3I4_9CLOT|nr:response regulator transcription factor [Clostridium aestuarii]MCY6485805.1 response regulator transcription factor [Clostridium aestuarii]
MFKIMIVEDDHKIREIMLENIKKWGFDGLYIEDFNEVFNVFLKYEPHLVLMDINLPSFDGFHWCNKIRALSKVPIVFISSRDTNMDIIMAMNMGGDDFVQKPFSIEVLMAKVNAILRRTYSYSNVETDVIEHDGAVLNLKDSNLIYNEKKLELTKNEFKIIYLLMKNSGKVVSRDKIMRSLWEDESFVDDNTLTVNINRLRKKLAGIGLSEFIETKKGQGYIII